MTCFELNDAIAHLYATLRAPQQIDGHVWYTTDPHLQAFERRVNQMKRYEVPVEDINYLFMNNCDSVQSAKYYLPRALELIANGERFINEFMLSMKVQQAGFQQWPDAERQAVVRVLLAMKSLAPGTHLDNILKEFSWALPASTDSP
ncbi:hypothetical protein [Fibrella aquatilis]|uniref:Uncharacterized protein n=1 Tax=Fibrella aquatilis TaxID=2817059 RepID=A0A939JZ79_9BACT|nr:hypothetical protein [Fibrella aquatilis]MBO0929890.1 hypothetical protein [Fibrella aquatilis]